MIYQFEDFELDCDQRELRRAGEVVKIEPKSFDLIALLVRESHRAVSKNELIEEVWRGRIVSDAAIDSRVKQARKALNDDGKQQRLIKTVRGHGLRFAGSVSDSDTAAAALSSLPEPENAAPVVDAPKAGGIWNFRAEAPVLAVLPFDNLSGDPAQEHIADGICEDILTMVSKIGQMRVIARNSTFRYKGQAVDIREVGQALGATHILEGSIRTAGNRLRVTGQLIDTKDATHLWAEFYDRTIDDIFDIQDDMTRHIVNAILRTDLVEGDVAKYWSRTTESFPAWQKQIQAMPLVVQNHERQKIQKGRNFAQAALGFDPNYAEAWGSVGASYLFEAVGCWTHDPADAIQTAANAYYKGYALAPQNPMLMCVKGFVDIYQGKHEEGLALVEEANNIDSDNIQLKIIKRFARIYCGNYDKDTRPHYTVPPIVTKMLTGATVQIHLLRGEIEQALPLLDRQISLLPAYPQNHALAAIAYASLGRDDEALLSLQRVKDLNPAFSVEHLPVILPIRDARVKDTMLEKLRALCGL